ncbi:hypothetical protein NDU88_000309 [Pleurodeles waltl]|uniref:Uncharacterized protein n=1 Tax=Pleurodeles waltl TaxID=8319 RepID=A0AAV7UQF2_PLEWA|nr:hypothetical protein NDU88_000309 [Pleurodeles waltl]
MVRWAFTRLRRCGARYMAAMAPKSVKDSKSRSKGGTLVTGMEAGLRRSDMASEKRVAGRRSPDNNCRISNRLLYEA